MLAGVTLCAGMLECFPHGRQTTLNVVMKFFKQAGQGPVAHLTISLQSWALMACSMPLPNLLVRKDAFDWNKLGLRLDRSSKLLKVVSVNQPNFLYDDATSFTSSSSVGMSAVGAINKGTNVAIHLAESIALNFLS